MNLCQYKDIFGKPGEGAHSYRLFNVAIVDVIFTIIAAYFIAKRYKWCFSKTLVSLFLLGIIAHRLFCVKTTVDKILFSD
jgi:hypothetical protein